MIDDFSFADYYKFGSDSRILPEFEVAPPAIPPPQARRTTELSPEAYFLTGISGASVVKPAPCAVILNRFIPDGKSSVQRLQINSGNSLSLKSSQTNE